MTDQAQPQPLNEGAEERGRLFQRLGTPAISLSVLVAVLYLLGFVGLYMPIYHHFISDPFTAMHAVSEIPHTVVIGEGILVFSTPASIAAAAIAFYILFIF